MPQKNKEKKRERDRKRYWRGRERILAKKREQYIKHPRFTKISKVREKIAVLYKEGFSLSQIAKTFECSVMAIWWTLERLGVPRRGRSESIRLIQTPEVRKKMGDARRGKPSGATGKTWKVGRIIKYPNRQGSKHHFWKGGRVELRDRIRTSVEYRFWREAVFQRDNYTCVSCGARSGNGKRVTLNADHRIPMARLLDRHQIKTIEDGVLCKALWDVSNGRTLCIDCHRKTETYGINREYLRIAE